MSRLRAIRHAADITPRVTRHAALPRATCRYTQPDVCAAAERHAAAASRYAPHDAAPPSTPPAIRFENISFSVPLTPFAPTPFAFSRFIKFCSSFHHVCSHISLAIYHHACLGDPPPDILFAASADAATVRSDPTPERQPLYAPDVLLLIRCRVRQAHSDAISRRHAAAADTRALRRRDRLLRARRYARFRCLCHADTMFSRWLATPPTAVPVCYDADAERLTQPYAAIYTAIRCSRHFAAPAFDVSRQPIIMPPMPSHFLIMAKRRHFSAFSWSPPFCWLITFAVCAQQRLLLMFATPLADATKLLFHCFTFAHATPPHLSRCRHV